MLCRLMGVDSRPTVCSMSRCTYRTYLAHSLTLDLALFSIYLQYRCTSHLLRRLPVVVAKFIPMLHVPKSNNKAVSTGN